MSKQHHTEHTHGRSRAPKARHPHDTATEVATAAVGAAAGAATGAIAGPVGMAAGAIVGGAIGAAAGVALDEGEAEAERHDERLDEQLGVEGGELGAPNLKHPPPKVGTYSASAAGAAPDIEDAAPDEGPLPKGDAGT